MKDPITPGAKVLVNRLEEDNESSQANAEEEWRIAYANATDSQLKSLARNALAIGCQLFDSRLETALFKIMKKRREIAREGQLAWQTMRRSHERQLD